MSPPQAFRCTRAPLLLLMLTASACSKSGMKLHRSDAAVSDAWSTTGSELGDTLDEMKGDHTTSPDVQPTSDSAVDGKPEASAADVLPGQDGVDLLPDHGTERPGEVGNVPDADLTVDLLPDASRIPSDMTVFLNRDLGDADAQCVADTASYLEVMATFLAEDRTCWSDKDCTVSAFADNCATICVFPLNHQRIGEFVNKVNSYGGSRCGSCPKAPADLACPVARDFYCNAGRCEYR